MKVFKHLKMSKRSPISSNNSVSVLISTQYITACFALHVTGVSNKNWLQGHVVKKKCSIGRRFKGKGLNREQFIEFVRKKSNSGKIWHFFFINYTKNSKLLQKLLKFNMKKVFKKYIFNSFLYERWSFNIWYVSGGPHAARGQRVWDPWHRRRRCFCLTSLTNEFDSLLGGGEGDFNARKL